MNRIVRIIDKGETNAHHHQDKPVDPVMSSAVRRVQVWMTNRTKGIIVITTKKDHDTIERMGTIG